MSGMGGKPGWRQAPGWLKLVLILSLSANVAVAGVVGGNAMRHRQDVPLSRMTHNEPGLDRRQTRILHMVPDQRRSEAREILLGRQDEYMAARVTMSAAQQTFTDAILVLHGGSVVFERYEGFMAPDDRHLLMSVSKSVVSTLCGILIGRGELHPEDVVPDHVDELAGTAWHDCTIRQLLPDPGRRIPDMRRPSSKSGNRSWTGRPPCPGRARLCSPATSARPRGS